MSSIGQRLRHAREFRGVTPEQLDQLAGIPAGNAARIEASSRGSKRDAELVAKLAAVLNVRVEWLQRGDSAPEVRITAENCLRLVPHVSGGHVQGRPVTWLACGEMVIERVAGTVERQRQMLAVLGTNQSPSKKAPASYAAWLVPEPTNPYDPHAVRVVVGEHHVGYLPADRAAPWQPILLTFMHHYGHYTGCPIDVYRNEGDGGGPSPYYADLRLPVSLGSMIVL